MRTKQWSTSYRHPPELTGAKFQSLERTDHETMTTLLVFEFEFPGPWGEEMARALYGLALDIAQEPGLIWKVWTEAPDRGVAGGVYRP
nr:YdhR family protein [Mesorhizobium loti]